MADYSGERFGFLSLLSRLPNDPGKPVKYLCRCDCGTEKPVAYCKVSSGNTVSCGCHRAAKRREWGLRNEFTGMTFGRLTVSERMKVAGRMVWRCTCSCGGSKVATTIYLKSSMMPSCGCAESEAAAARRFVDLAGSRFGKLVVQRHAGFNKHRQALWECLCDCGASYTSLNASLRAGRTISCGCARKDAVVHMPADARSKSAVLCAKRRARKLGAGGDHSEADIQRIYGLQRGRCASCGVPLGAKFQRDHRRALALGGDNSALNMECLCTPCNQRKNAKDEIAWANENGRLC